MLNYRFLARQAAGCVLFSIFLMEWGCLNPLENAVSRVRRIHCVRFLTRVLT